jgi:hypothetical protein
MLSCTLLLLLPLSAAAAELVGACAAHEHGQQRQLQAVLMPLDGVVFVRTAQGVWRACFERSPVLSRDAMQPVQRQRAHQPLTEHRSRDVGDSTVSLSPVRGVVCFCIARKRVCVWRWARPRLECQVTLVLYMLCV